MLRSFTFSFGVVAALLLATAVSLTPREAGVIIPAPSGDSNGLYSGYVILKYYNPSTKETNSYGRYFVTVYDNGHGDYGGLDEAIHDLLDNYHYSPKNIWLIDEQTGTAVDLPDLLLGGV